MGRATQNYCNRFQVAVILPGSDRQTDAIQICVDHTDNYSRDCFFLTGSSEAGLLWTQHGESASCSRNTCTLTRACFNCTLERVHRVLAKTAA
jgi:hypothetical protein